MFVEGSDNRSDLHPGLVSILVSSWARTDLPTRPSRLQTATRGFCYTDRYKECIEEGVEGRHPEEERDLKIREVRKGPVEILPTSFMMTSVDL